MLINPEELSIILYDDLTSRYRGKMPLSEKIKNGKLEEYLMDLDIVANEFSRKYGCDIVKKVLNAKDVIVVEHGLILPDKAGGTLTIRNVFVIQITEDKSFKFNFDLNLYPKSSFN